MKTENRANHDAGKPDSVDCVVVGGGPAGLMLGLLLALKNVQVLVCESHPDFDREFRGDTLHPSTMEILNQVGLADKLLEIPHGKVQDLTFHVESKKLRVVNLALLKSKYNYIAMMPQAKFLDFLAGQAKKLPSFHLAMAADVRKLLEQDGQVVGVSYRLHDGVEREVHAKLVVAADGRFSIIRKLAGLTPEASSPPMDVIWFKLSKKPTDPAEPGAGYIHKGRLLILLDREDSWQVGMVFAKGTYQTLKSAGIESFRKKVVGAVSWLADRIDELADWKDCSVLSVESSRLKRWHKPGLLLIGDAAHVMSPVGGVGINYAIQDAVVAANILAEPLSQGVVTEVLLAKVQAEREGPVATIQKVQSYIQKNIVAQALQSDGRTFRFPWTIRLMNAIPGLRSLPASMIGFGPKRVRIEKPVRMPSPHPLP